jgi:Domain of unknown function (DUF4440)
LKFRGIILFLACASLPLLGVSTPAPQHEQDSTSTILRIEDQWLHAKTAQDAAQFLAADFVGVSTRGIIETRAQRLARFRPGPQPPATAIHFEHMAIAFPASGIAIATGQVVATGSGGTPVYTVSFSDTFCLRRGRWLTVHAQETLASPHQ